MMEGDNRAVPTVMCAVALITPSGLEAQSLDPSPQEACEYFVERVVSDNLHGVVVEFDFPSVETTMLELERYRTFLLADVSATQRPTGSPFNEPMALISVNALCDVDVKDRRVLRVIIEPGPRVGSQSSYSDGHIPIIAPPPTKEHIGLGAGEGRY